MYNPRTLEMFTSRMVVTFMNEEKWLPVCGYEMNARALCGEM